MNSRLERKNKNDFFFFFNDPFIWPIIGSSTLLGIIIDTERDAMASWHSWQLTRNSAGAACHFLQGFFIQVSPCDFVLSLRAS